MTFPTRLWLFLALLLAVSGSVALTPAAAAQAMNPPELVLHIGHFDKVTTLAFSPDNRLVASASVDQTIKIWDVKTKSLSYSLTGNPGRISGLAFSPDSAELYSVSVMGQLRAWDTHSGDILSLPVVQWAKRSGVPALSMRGQLATIWCGGKEAEILLVAIANADKSIRLQKIDMKARKVADVGTLSGHQADVLALTFSPDGKTLASGDKAGKVRTWDTEDGSLQRNLSGHAMRIDDLAFSADSRMLADACFDGESFLYDLKTGKRVGELNMNRPEDGVGAVAFSPDGLQVVTGGHGGPKGNEYLKMWDAKTYQEKQVLKGHEGFVSALAYSANGALIASGSRDNTVRLWNARTGQEVGSSGSIDYLTSLAFSPDGKSLASGSGDKQVRLWNALTGVMEHILTGHTGGVKAVVYSSDGALLASGGKDGKALIWNAHTGVLLQTLTSPGGAVNALAFSADKTLLVGGCGATYAAGSVQVWDLKTGMVAKTLEGQSLQPVKAVAFTPDGGQIVSASEYGGGGEVRFWEAKTGAQLFKEFGHGFHALALTSDGKTLLTGGAVLEAPGDPTGDELKVWNARTQTLQKTLTAIGTGGGINALALSPDNITAVSGSQDRQIRVWNIRTGETLKTFSGHPAPVVALALTASGDRLATAGADNTLRIWHLNSGKLLATLIPLPAETPFRESTDWLAITPDGYYDGSAGAGRLIQWRMGDNLYPIEAFENKLHRPERVIKALDPVPLPFGNVTFLPPVPEQRTNIGMPPQIIFNSPQADQSVMGNRVSVKLTVTSSSKIAQIEVLANGRPLGAKPISIEAKPISIEAKPIEIGNRSLPAGHTNLQQFQMEVILPLGETQVTLTARAADASGLQAREELRVNPVGAVAVAGNLYVLAVGVSHYKNPKYNLKYAGSDAAAFARLWKERSATLYQKVEVTQLTDDQATSANIRAAFKKLQEKASPADSVVIFLSGHGVQANASDYYFASQDIDATSIETVRHTGLPWMALEETLGALKARHVFMFLDACHSGNALGGQLSSSESLAGLLVKQAGVMVFSSSRGSEFSYELDELHHGAFTAAILEGIGEGKANFDIGGQHDGVITAIELLTYLRARVPQLTGNMQTPTCPLMRDFGEASPLARGR